MFRQYLIDEIEKGIKTKNLVKHLNNGAKRWKD